MALIVSQQVETTIPIEVQGITPDALVGKTLKQISKLPILYGRHEVEFGELFKITGSLEGSVDSSSKPPTLVFDGLLKSVHWIGAGQQGGKIEIQSDAGRHVGSQMTGGRIICKSNVSDYLGVEMTGGSISISGNAGDCVGGHYPGSKFGMNRGSILISGNVGKGLGQAMRILGQCGEYVGASMRRGTIVVAGGSTSQLLPTFSAGGSYRVPILAMLANWLKQQRFPSDVSVLNSVFQEFNGDQLNGGRGEVLDRRRHFLPFPLRRTGKRDKTLQAARSFRSELHGPFHAVFLGQDEQDQYDGEV